ncbi:hypothetical protein V1511DRAFT_487442 [Dipodascopsis uninucleata]
MTLLENEKISTNSSEELLIPKSTKFIRRNGKFVNMAQYKESTCDCESVAYDSSNKRAYYPVPDRIVSQHASMMLDPIIDLISHSALNQHDFSQVFPKKDVPLYLNLLAPNIISVDLSPDYSDCKRLFLAIFNRDCYVEPSPQGPPKRRGISRSSSTSSDDSNMSSNSDDSHYMSRTSTNTSINSGYSTADSMQYAVSRGIPFPSGRIIRQGIRGREVCRFGPNKSLSRHHTTDTVEDHDDNVSSKSSHSYSAAGSISNGGRKKYIRTQSFNSALSKDRKSVYLNFVNYSRVGFRIDKFQFEYWDVVYTWKRSSSHGNVFELYPSPINSSRNLLKLNGYAHSGHKPIATATYCAPGWKLELDIPGDDTDLADKVVSTLCILVYRVISSHSFHIGSPLFEFSAGSYRVSLELMNWSSLKRELSSMFRHT